MSEFNRVPVSMLRRDDVFASYASATNATVDPKLNEIYVKQQSGEIVTYTRTVGATDLVTNGGTVGWKKGTLTQADLLSALVSAINAAEFPVVSEGTFTPGLGFTTVGDSTITFGTFRRGRWQRFGNRVDFSVNFNPVTINKGSTGSGALRIYYGDSGMSASDLNQEAGMVRYIGQSSGTSGITFSTGTAGLAVLSAPSANYVEIMQHRSALASLQLGASNFPAGSVNYIIQATWSIEL